VRRKPTAGVLILAGVLLFPSIAFAAGEDPSIPLLLYLVVILLAPVFFVQMGVQSGPYRVRIYGGALALPSPHDRSGGR
jgi:hypothetical protein